MEYFIEEKGKYIFRGGAAGLSRRIFTIVIIASGIMMLGVSLTLYISLKNQASSSYSSVIPFIPVMVFPVTLIVLLTVRKHISNAGTVSIDYMNGLVSFSHRVYNTYRTVTVETGQISRIMLTRKESASYGFPGGLLWTVSIMTDSGQYDLMADRGEMKARGFATEFSSLVSRSVDDLTRGT